MKKLENGKEQIYYVGDDVHTLCIGATRSGKSRTIVVQSKALLSISDVAPSRTRGSFYTSALTTLRLFTSKSIYGITNQSDFSITGVGEKKQALFIILPDEKTTFYPVASLIISQQYELLAVMAWLLSTIPDHMRLFTIENGTREFDLVKEDERGNVVNNVVHTVTRYSEDPKQNIDQEKLLDIGLALENIKYKIANEVYREWIDAVIACQEDKTLKTTLTPIISKLSDMRVVAAELDIMLYEPMKEFITMALLLVGNIPLIYFLNRSWFDTLMNTVVGKGILAVSAAALFVSLAAVIRLTRPIEYKR